MGGSVHSSPRHLSHHIGPACGRPSRARPRICVIGVICGSVAGGRCSKICVHRFCVLAVFLREGLWSSFHTIEPASIAADVS
jgi:hypothetical protein